MKSALFLALGLVMAVGSALAAPATTAERRPNLLFILADDYGTAELSCYGADHYRTPNLDRLAQEGLRFTRVYTPSLCGPSRAQILTGRYPFRTGATNQDATGRYTPAQWTMLPRVLKTAGYATSAVGKWGQLPLDPAAFGFDDYLMFTGSGVYWNTQAKGRTYTVNGQKVDLRDGEYLPDLMHRHAVEFIERNRDRPFYLYYSLSHVHNEILRTPDSAADSKDYYTDNVVYMDKLVGRLLAELERLHLRENTLIVFLGDNGTASARADRATIGGRRLSGSKGSMLEGGALVPLIVNWPGVVPANRVVDDLVDTTDFFPTFAELARAELPRDLRLDGRSLAARFRGQPGQPREWAFNQLANRWYVRSAGWKLNEKGELFDMSDAPFAERLVPADSADPAARAARRQLQAALDELAPASGIKDDGDGTGRHARRGERESADGAKP
jgi:arylsulfatase A